MRIPGERLCLSTEELTISVQYSRLSVEARCLPYFLRLLAKGNSVLKFSYTMSHRIIYSPENLSEVYETLIHFFSIFLRMHNSGFMIVKSGRKLVKMRRTIMKVDHNTLRIFLSHN